MITLCREAGSIDYAAATRICHRMTLPLPVLILLAAFRAFVNAP